MISIVRLDPEEGGTIPDCRLAVTTFGELNAAKIDQHLGDLLATEV